MSLQIQNLQIMFNVCMQLFSLDSETSNSQTICFRSRALRIWQSHECFLHIWWSQILTHFYRTQMYDSQILTISTISCPLFQTIFYRSGCFRSWQINFCRSVPAFASNLEVSDYVKVTKCSICLSRSRVFRFCAMSTVFLQIQRHLICFRCRALRIS